MTKSMLGLMLIGLALAGCGPSKAEQIAIAEKAIERTLREADRTPEVRAIAGKVENMQGLQRDIAWQGRPTGGGLSGFSERMGNAAGEYTARQQQGQLQKIIGGQEHALTRERHRQAFRLMTPEEREYVTTHFPDFARLATGED